MRNLSADGALLDVEPPVHLPVDFDLHIAKTDALHHCRLVWNTARRIGVRFGDTVPEGARRRHLRVVT